MGRARVNRKRLGRGPQHKRLRIHPLFLFLGIFYAFTGELFLFFISTLVALQHELAHAIASAKMGYRLRSIVLMPYGAVIDGDLKGISLKDEITVALWGPLCNLFTALFFVAIWWLVPTMYAFTDVVFLASLSICVVNLLPAYPLDGGRILRCLFMRYHLKRCPDEALAERKSIKTCRIISLLFSFGFLGTFLSTIPRKINLSLLLFGIFLFLGAFGNKDKSAIYERLDFSKKEALRNGIEIRRVAVRADCSVKHALRFLSPNAYLVLEVYDEKETHLFDLPQNEFSALFSLAKTPYESLSALYSQRNRLKPVQK